MVGRTQNRIAVSQVTVHCGRLEPRIVAEDVMAMYIHRHQLQIKAITTGRPTRARPPRSLGSLKIGQAHRQLVG